MFTKTFAQYACTGDAIECVADGFTFTARIERDDCSDKPDERDDGFWPSHDKDAAGYVLPENYEKEMAKAERVMAAWRKDQWFYCGIVISVSRAGIELDSAAASLWGIECNYPDSDNSYLSTVANELLPEAKAAAQALMAKLVSIHTVE